MSMDADALLRSQQDLQGRIARVYENLKKSGAAKITAGAVESRLKALEANWSKFETNHEALRTMYWKAVADHEYIKKDFFGLVEESFLTQRGTLLDLTQSLKEPIEQAEPTEAGASQPRRTLPRIQLPTFSGKYEEWPAFRDLFRSLITTDASVSGVERLHYLRTSVKGEAEQLIRNLPTTGDNFDRAWSMLADHYENKRLLVRSCFSAFTSTPRMKNESAADLKRIFHGMLSTVGTLESIGRPISDCTDLFVHLVVEMLDPRSRREWETAVSDTSEPPSYETLKTFLECRMRTLEALQPSKTESPSSPSNKAASATSRSARSHLAQKTTKKSGRCAQC
ncbi:hypothetical protein RF55_22190 [Lasius niger]|uniref:Uncharacterized protein n=1 Tax=Lasius niger TaxID=67767 RepID=A0A0J7MQ25_LASNI|nr:hypothetical protein RF55_22190 [Lasius niger]